MAWHKYTLVFKLLSPLHVGFRKVGNLQQTRKYVPGKIIWAALTARLTRDYDNGGDASAYQKVGKALKTHFRFGYFYPALAKKSLVQKPNDVEVKYPWEDALFDYRFRGSFASTALAYDVQSAEEGTLHETEFISPRARPVKTGDTPQQVYLKGDIYVHAPETFPAPLNRWQGVLSKLQLGGERNAGWGRVELAAQFDSQETPQIELKEGARVTAHVLATGRTGVTEAIKGEVEPLVGWERAPASQNRKTWRISQALICYPPGSIVAADMSLDISEQYGILTPIQSDR